MISWKVAILVVGRVVRRILARLRTLLSAMERAAPGCGSLCQSSSVRKGIAGCSRRSAASSAAKILRQAGTAISRLGIRKLRFDPFDVPVGKSPQKN